MPKENGMNLFEFALKVNVLNDEEASKVTLADAPYEEVKELPIEPLIK